MPTGTTTEVTPRGDSPQACRHCGAPVPEGAELDGYCCRGCAAVRALLIENGLDAYYRIAGGAVAPASEAPRESSFAWLEPILERASAGSGPVCSVELDVQGIHCAACVWLMNEIYRRERGGAEIQVNPALGKVRLSWARGALDVRGFLERIERFGYRFGPSRKRADAASSDLPMRMGVCAAITINVMLFSVSFYLGLAPSNDRALFELFTKLSLILSTIVVLVGGSVFFKAAWQGLRSGLLHLDLPIAAGIALAYGASVWQIASGRGGDHIYLDTLNVFVTLMLVGRWLQRRVLERNRRFLLEDGGVDSLVVKRREGDRVAATPAPLLRAGDELVVAPGDLVPVDAEVIEGRGSFSTDWITGEPDEVAAGPGDTVRAGSFHAGRAAVVLRALTDFADSPLPQLLRAAPAATGAVPSHARFWDRLARIYVLVVLALATGALALWWRVDAARAIDVTVALLVVTCPCALGIAAPLAYELTQARLRRAGLFVRRADLLDKLPRVRKVLFDKTGTLTLGRLRLSQATPVSALSDELRDAAYDMAARSNHPVSRCLAEALSHSGARLSPDAHVEEEPGVGLSLARSGHVYRLGREDADAQHHDGDRRTALTMDGVAQARFATEETLRADAGAEIARLQAEGLEVWMISGDHADRVAATAAALGIPKDRALGGLRPEEKAAAVARIDAEDTLYIGDGVNDSLAFERALCAGTPAIDRPVMPGKSDFFLLGEGTAVLREAIRAARLLRWVVRRNLTIAVAYNVLAVAACYLGWMTPLRAALAMPASSLGIIALTLHSLSPRRRARRETAPPAPAARMEQPAWTS